MTKLERMRRVTLDRHAFGQRLQPLALGGRAAWRLPMSVVGEQGPGEFRHADDRRYFRQCEPVGSDEFTRTVQAIAKAGFDITPSSAADLTAFVKTEIVKWAKVVKDSGAKAE